MIDLDRRVQALIFLLMALGLAVSPTAASTETKTAAILEDQSWQHEQSMALFPALAAGMPLQQIQTVQEPQLDVILKYQSEDSDTRLTFYIYRPAINNLPLWFDVADSTLQDNIDFLSETQDRNFRIFTPPGQSNASGMLVTYALASDRFSSTGLAMAPIGPWLIKLRYTSTGLTPAKLADEMLTALETIRWPRQTVPAPQALAVVECPDTLELHEETEQVTPSMTDALIGGLFSLADTADEEEQETASAAVTYCRDPADHGQWTLYRADAGRDSYVMPLGDAGRAISIQRNDVAIEISGNGKQRFTPTLLQLDKKFVFADVTDLPTVDTLLAILDRNVVVTTVSTIPEDGSTIEIDSSLIEEE